MPDPVTELVELVAQYQRGWKAVHGDHPPIRCPWCRELHERHARALAALEASLDDDDPLEAAA